MTVLEFLNTLSADHLSALEGIFDDEVHNEKSMEARAINNGGIEARVSYLESRGWDQENLIQKMKDVFSCPWVMLSIPENADGESKCAEETSGD